MSATLHDAQNLCANQPDRGLPDGPPALRPPYRVRVRVFRRNTLALGCALLCLNCWMPLPSAAATATVQTLLTNGPAANRLNVAFLSEGYTSNQLGQFLLDATNALNVLLNKAPFQEYRSYVNAVAISVASNQSGSDHPTSGLYKDTYFNSSYDSVSDLYITVPPNEFDSNSSHGQGKIDTLLQQFVPNCNLSILLVNDIVPGGSDGFDKTAIFSSGYFGFLPHEVGHVLAGLGDEYEWENPGYPDTEKANTTRETRREYIKWKAWIATNTPLPTPTTYSDAIGLFQGAHYHSTGWYRPKLDCAMRSPDSEFCEVCSEAIVLALYSQVRPIDSFVPAATNLTLFTSDQTTFSLSIPQPRTHALTVQWLTNGMVAASGSTNFALPAASLKAGTNLIRAVVTDPTGLVRTDPNNRLRQTNTWVVNVQTLPMLAIKVSGTNVVISGTGGAPGSTYRALTAPAATLPMSNWTILLTNVFDAGGNCRFTNAIQRSLPARSYRLQVP